MIGRPDSDVVTGSLRSAQAHGLPHEMLDATEIRRRFPPFKPAEGEVALHETRAGVLRAEECVAALHQRATAAGADLRSNERVLGWTANPGGEGVVVRTTYATFQARHLVLTPGPWATSLFNLPGVPLSVERQTLFWFAPVGGVSTFAPGRFPIYIWDTGDGRQFYGFPSMPGAPFGVKVAFFRSGDENIVSPDSGRSDCGRARGGGDALGVVESPSRAGVRCARASRHLSVYAHTRSSFRRRTPSRPFAGDDCVAVLRSWFQIRDGDRRDHRRPGGGWRTRHDIDLFRPTRFS